MRFSTKITLALLQLFIFSIASAQNNFWSDIPEASLRSTSQKRLIIPEKGRTLLLEKAQVKAFLQSAPKEFTSGARANKTVLSVPMPYGGYQSFSIMESPMLEAGLAAQLPDVKTYSGQGIDDPAATIKIDISDFGFHAMILSPVGGAVFIDPYNSNSEVGYISCYKSDFKSSKKLVEKIRSARGNDIKSDKDQQRTEAGVCVGGTLRTYRLAIACTGEYAEALGATTKAQALSKIVTTVNRVNGIYEKEVDIRLILVANNLKVVFVNPATDEFTGNDDALVLVEESQKVITDSIGTANYDIGHTFSTGEGGYAPGFVCDAKTKAMGITGSPVPAGDPFDVDFVAHEMGHQFNATHTFNGETGQCNQAGETIANVEPGSGSTIMAYAGICGSNNLQANTDPQFHAISFDQITAYINTGNGKNCGVASSTGNAPPVVNAGTDYTIPKSTPFILTGSATDPNGDALTYSWEEIDFGGPFGNAASPTGRAPLFRSFAPVLTPSRIFPRLSSLLNNTSAIGEVLPSYGRIVNFRLTARDNKAAGGGVCFDEMRMTVSTTTGPFLLTSPNTATSWDVGTFKTITWNVAGSNLSPVNCANVAIQLSTDGGQTFPVTILASTPNDGSEEIIVPDNVTTQARIRVMSVGNIFFDISNVNFSIKNVAAPDFVFNAPATNIKCDGSNLVTQLKTNGLAGYNTPIKLTATGNPAGTTVVFSANNINPGENVNVMLQGNPGSGQYTINISGLSGSITKTVSLVFAVGTPSPVSSLISPANKSIGQSTLPTFNWGAGGASSYVLEISTTANFDSLVQSVSNITTNSYTLVTPLAENTEYYWRVKASNACGSAAPSAPALFRTFAQACAPVVTSTNVPKTISATRVATVTSNLVIANGVTINDINVVGLKGTHDYISDIGITLTSPANTTVVLFDRICDDELNFDLNLDDESTTTTFPCPPTGNITVRPVELLSAFDGESSTGTWVLSVTDNFDTDGGSLTGWGLRICSNIATPLPVNYLSFSGQKGANSSVSLQWSTANEVNNHHYEIEKSADGLSFLSIGTMKSGNNPAMLQQYFFSDGKPFSGANYYRLKQVDKDGNFTYSAVVRINIESNRLLWTVYPNPAHNQSKIRMLSNLSQVNISLTDASGKLVYRSYLAAVKAGELIDLPVNNLAKGIYLLKIETATGSKSDKIIVQ